jgi:hypothetical protein
VAERKSADQGTKLLQFVLLDSHAAARVDASIRRRATVWVLAGDRSKPSEQAERGLPPWSGARLNSGLARSAGHGAYFGVARIREAGLAPSLIAVSAIGRWQ